MAGEILQAQETETEIETTKFCGICVCQGEGHPRTGSRESDCFRRGTVIVSFFGIRDAARSNPDLISSHAQETLATLDPGEIIFEAPVDYVRRRLPELRAEHGPFDAVVAVMHMLMPNDLALAGRRASRVESEHERADAQRRRVGTRRGRRQDMKGGSERR